MTAFIKIGLWIGAAVILALTVWLGWQNRASEKLLVNLPSAILVGFGTVLVTLIFSLKPESMKEEFPVDFIVDPISKEPFSCEFFPEIIRYADPAYMVSFSPWWNKIVPTLREEAPDLAEATDFTSLMQIYNDVLLRIVLDVMERTFEGSWDITVTHYNLPTGGSRSYTPATDPPRHGIKVQHKDIAKLFPQSYGLRDTGSSPHLTLPPNTKLSRGSNIPWILKLQNTFARVEIAIHRQGITSGVGPTIDSLCRLGFDEHKFRTINFVIRLSAEFDTFRGGHPDMPAYKRWVTTAFSELRRLSSEVRWAEVKEQYQLLYANRTESPTQERIRKLQNSNQ